MAWVILLGLTTSAVHTLSVVPALYLALGAKAAAHDTDDLEDVDIQGQPQLQRS
jgi:hypothetical protein